LAALFRSNAWLAVVMITDVFGETTRFNVPGAVADSNWSERVRGTPEEWRRDPVRVEKMARVAGVIRAGGRL